jgi:polyisoprenoid-binding protein YceI
MSWTMDASHSQIQFSVRHMMISNVRGLFETFNGVIDVDEQKPENSKVNIKIETASINTRDAKRDEHLRSADFFDTEKYPGITYVSKKVKKSRPNACSSHRRSHYPRGKQGSCT